MCSRRRGTIRAAELRASHVLAQCHAMAWHAFLAVPSWHGRHTQRNAVVRPANGPRISFVYWCTRSGAGDGLQLKARGGDDDGDDERAAQ